MAGNAVVGKNCKLYYNSATHATPTWVEIPDAMDLSVPMTKAEADVSSRSSIYKMFMGGQLEVGIEFGYLHNAGSDSIHTVLLAAYNADTPKEFAALDGGSGTPGSKGLRAYCLIFDHSQDQNLDEGLKHNMTLKATRFIESSAVVSPDQYVIV